MAITRTKTWNVDTRYLIASASRTTHARMQLYHSMQILKTLGWVVVGTSDAVTADSIVIGSHGSDRWTAPSKCIYAAAGTAHSWIVIENPNLYNHYQLLVDMAASGGEPYYSPTYSSPAGQFSGGSTTARPTATDEITIQTSNSYFQNGWAIDARDTYLAGIGSSDGHCTRLLKFVGSPGALSIGSVAMIFDRVQNAPSWWTEKYVTPKYIGTGSAVAINFTRSDFLSASGLKAMVNTTTPANIRDVRCTGEAMAATYLPDLVATDYGGAPVVIPVGLCIDATVQKGWLGNLYDAYWVDQDHVNCAPMVGTGAPWNWIKWGDAIFGWDGNVPNWVPYSYV